MLPQLPERKRGLSNNFNVFIHHFIPEGCASGAAQGFSGEADAVLMGYLSNPRRKS